MYLATRHSWSADEDVFLSELLSNTNLFFAVIQEHKYSLTQLWNLVTRIQFLMKSD